MARRNLKKSDNPRWFPSQPFLTSVLITSQLPFHIIVLSESFFCAKISSLLHFVQSTKQANKQSCSLCSPAFPVNRFQGTFYVPWVCEDKRVTSRDLFGKDFTVECDYKGQIVAITGSLSEGSWLLTRLTLTISFVIQIWFEFQCKLRVDMKNKSFNQHLVISTLDWGQSRQKLQHLVSKLSWLNSDKKR